MRSSRSAFCLDRRNQRYCPKQSFSSLFFRTQVRLTKMRSHEWKDGGYVAQAAAFHKSDTKRIKLLQFIMTNSDRQLVAEGYGNTTIGCYENRISLMKVKEAVRSFARYE